MNSSCFIICVLDSFYGNSKAFSCYSRKMFFRKGFEPEVHGNLTRLSFLSSRTQWNRKRFSPLRANMLFVSKNCSLEKVAFMNSSCFIICELNWIVFMAIVKHFRVKMRLAFLCCCANLIKYKYTYCLVSLLFSLTSNGKSLQREWRFSASYVVCFNKMFRWKRILWYFLPLWIIIHKIIMLCIEFSSLRLKRDTGGYF